MAKQEKSAGLKRLIKGSGGRKLGEPCDNCKCRRYNKCTCQRKNKGE